MTRPPVFAPARLVTSTLSALAALFVVGLMAPPPARAADPGFITAKTWIDPASGHAAVGDGAADDTQNLQDLINYGIGHAEAIQLEPGIYRITKTLMIADAIPGDQKIGFRLSGIGGPNLSPYNAPGNMRGGVSIVLDASATAQPAILEVGVGAFYDMAIENIGLVSSVPKGATKYGLLFGGQNFSHAFVHMVSVASVDTAFAIDPQPGIPPGGNGEQVDLDECKAFYINCYYYNHSPSGQALGHSLAKCGGAINNGGCLLRFGAGSPGLGVEVTSTLVTYADGPLRNTLIECDDAPTSVNMTGGRIEHADTLLTYSGGTDQLMGHIVIRGIDFDGTSIYHPTGSSKWVPKSFPLIDDTLNGTVHNPNVQYINVVEDCRINGDYGAPFPTLSLVGISDDHSRTYFHRDTFTGYKNSLVDPANAALQTSLKNLHMKITDCRENIGTTGSVPFTDISYP